MAEEVYEEEVDPQLIANKKYRNTENGKESIKKQNSKQSSKEARDRYAKSPAGKEAYDRWKNSPKGQETTRLREEKQKRALQMLRWEEEGKCGLCGDPKHAVEYHLR